MVWQLLLQNTDITKLFFSSNSVTLQCLQINMNSSACHLRPSVIYFYTIFLSTLFFSSPFDRLAVLQLYQITLEPCFMKVLVSKVTAKCKICLWSTLSLQTPWQCNGRERYKVSKQIQHWPVLPSMYQQINWTPKSYSVFKH